MGLKKTVRDLVLEKRGFIPLSERRRKDVSIRNRLFNTQEFKVAKKVLFYASFRTEVDTIGMIEEALKMNKRVIVPKVVKEGHRLRLYEIKDIGELTPGYMGIPEPTHTDERLININDIDLVIIPGAGFDYSGNRLGYGAGYYDILLSEVREKILLIGLAYEEQIVSSIPSEVHDIKVDMIITDEQVIKVAEG